MGPKLTPRFDRLGRIRRLGAEDGLASEHTTTACFSLFACALFLEVQGLSELRHPLLLRQLLEAVGPFDTERDFVGHLAVGPKEPPRTLHWFRRPRQVHPERARSRPIANPVDEVVGDRISQQVDELGEAIGRVDQVDRVRLLGGPEVLPSPSERVHRLGEHLVEMSEERGKVCVVVADEQVLMIAHGDEAVERDLVALRCLAEAIEID
ncbi:MAG: hypothetical protein J0I07_17455, partial [Myxococcales bacterium]|nr:hypothetical protein [Myxococcales bacterium]